jgi:hypothetical protein
MHKGVWLCVLTIKNLYGYGVHTAYDVWDPLWVSNYVAHVIDGRQQAAKFWRWRQGKEWKLVMYNNIINR